MFDMLIFLPVFPLPYYQLIIELIYWSKSGDPKAIGWTHLSPIRCSEDAWAHVDIQEGDVYCWPTNLGWVMGPILLYSTFLCGATLALFHGSPLSRGFGKFVQVLPAVCFFDKI